MRHSNHHKSHDLLLLLLLFTSCKAFSFDDSSWFDSMCSIRKKTPTVGVCRMPPPRLQTLNKRIKKKIRKEKNNTDRTEGTGILWFPGIGCSFKKLIASGYLWMFTLGWQWLFKRKRLRSNCKVPTCTSFSLCAPLNWQMTVLDVSYSMSLILFSPLLQFDCKRM